LYRSANICLRNHHFALKQNLNVENDEMRMKITSCN
jgi:hypothetical protein